MNILVTGGCVFVRSHVIEMPKKQGNRMSVSILTDKIGTLGLNQEHNLKDHLKQFN